MPDSLRVKKPRTGALPPSAVDLPPTPTPAPTTLAGLAGPGISPSLLEDLPSPLFFSHSPYDRRASLPQAFRPPDISTSILSRMDHDMSGAITTVKLPQPTTTTTTTNTTSASAGLPPHAAPVTTPSSLTSSTDLSAPALTPDTRFTTAGLQALTGFDVLELLDHDARPTFLIDLADPSLPGRAYLHILFYNSALRTSPGVLRLLTSDLTEPTVTDDYRAFRDWATGSNARGSFHSTPPTPYKFGPFTWTCRTLRRRFRVVSGNPDPTPDHDDPSGLVMDQAAPASVGRHEGSTSPNFPVTPEVSTVEPPDYFGDAQSDMLRRASTTTVDMDANNVDGKAVRAWEHPDEFAQTLLQKQAPLKSFDWTRVPYSDDLPAHIKMARSFDWSSTPLGPMEDWSPALRSISSLVMATPSPCALYWGPQHITIYNDGYTAIAGQKHPALMGSRYADMWSEIWPDIAPLFQAAWESGQSVMEHDVQYFVRRNGYLEEAFFSFSIVPVLGHDGEVVGIYNPAFDNTRRKVAERRLLTLREIGEHTASATTVKGFWPQVQRGLEVNHFDVPFALIYSVDFAASDETSSSVVLEGSIGVPENHQAAIAKLDLSTSDEGFAPYMRQSRADGGTTIVLSVDDGTMPHHLISGLDWQGFKEPCRTIVVLPIVPNTANESAVGFIVMGTSPRRPYDEDYQLFVHLISRQLATSMASAVLFEKEIARGRRAAQRAAVDRQRLITQLQRKSQEANETEYKLNRMAEFAPVGMFIADPDGHISFCNDRLMQFSGLVRGEHTANAWMDNVRPEDRPAVADAWSRLLAEKVTVSVEFRFVRSHLDGNTIVDTWALMSAYPEMDEDGNLNAIFGCITDISSQKLAEKVQNERREEAVELKRQQENFIDITSHEMRNPLSAVLQCSDQITDNIASFAAHSDEAAVRALLDSCLDAANTINLCSTHQKRIVDDILTLSKLDSNLLGVAPIDEQPVRVIKMALKLFEAELAEQDIDFELIVDPSFERHGVKWAKIDPPRLRQILINLMANAIKFTQTRERRAIKVRVGVCKEGDAEAAAAAAAPGLEADDGVHYFDRDPSQTRNAVADMDSRERGWGDGDKITIHCSIEDTGPGIVKEELEQLFKRFQKATPRTHVQYGGSGLGLFISRILTEIQGGQIGVSSRPGEGSKVSFYIQSRVSVDPPTDTDSDLAAFGRALSPVQVLPSTVPPPMPATAVAAADAPAPAAAAAAAAADANGNTTTAPPAGAAHEAKMSMTKPQPLFDVLIVEDNIVNQKVLQRQLANCGNTTLVANHGQEALATLERSRFWAGREAEGVDISVILMDLEMPVMDGMTCTRRIRELQAQGVIVRHIPIIAVTAYSRPEQIESAKAAGIVSHPHFLQPESLDSLQPESPTLSTARIT